MGSMEVLLGNAGFAGINVDIKEESREVIAQWMPGSGAEDYVVSANISAVKPSASEGDCCDVPSSCCPPSSAAPVAATGCCDVPSSCCPPPAAAPVAATECETDC